MNLSHLPYQAPAARTRSRRLALVIALAAFTSLPVVTSRAGDDPKSAAPAKTLKADKAAAQSAAKKKAASAKAKSATQLDTIETGSLVKQKVRRSGQITHGTSQVIVIDRQQIERSGASTVSQLMRKYPVVFGP